MAEFDLIERIRARVATRDDVVLGIGDDAALLQVPVGMQLVVAMDTLNAGVHFPDATAPDDIGWKALAVNLSDLSAMGATPAWCTLSLSLPHADAAWVDAFLDGFLALADAHRVALVGGDTTRGPLSVCVTVHGFVEPGRALRRDGARIGDEVWVSGTLGDAAGSLVQWRGEALQIVGNRSLRSGADGDAPLRSSIGGAGSDARLLPSGQGALGEAANGDAPSEKQTAAARLYAHEQRQEHEPNPEHEQSNRHRHRRRHEQVLRTRLDRPTPRVALGNALGGLAHACIDISDGLLADLAHVAYASRVAIGIDVDALPASDALRSAFADERLRALQATGGDDYELCFTAPPRHAARIEQASAACGVPITRIGRVIAGAGVHAFDRTGNAWTPSRTGWVHFA